MEQSLRVLRHTVERFVPGTEAEAADRLAILETMDRFSDILTRENRLCHMTASAWVVNQTRDKVLMVHHNLYNAWSWTGGHADGDADLAAVALREVREETGISHLRLLSDAPISLEILTVEAHKKRGQQISPHLHCNLTYLIEADDAEPLAIKPDENSAVRWLPLSEAVECCTEPKMVPIYQKLNDRVKAFCE